MTLTLFTRLQDGRGDRRKRQSPSRRYGPNSPVVLQRPWPCNLRDCSLSLGAFTSLHPQPRCIFQQRGRMFSRHRDRRYGNPSAQRGCPYRPPVPPGCTKHGLLFVSATSGSQPASRYLPLHPTGLLSSPDSQCCMIVPRGVRDAGYTENDCGSSIWSAMRTNGGTRIDRAMLLSAGGLSVQVKTSFRD